MKKTISLVVALCLVSHVFATNSLSNISNGISTATADVAQSATGSLVIDDSLVNAVETQSESNLIKELTDAKTNLKLQGVRSCEDFDSVLTKWIEKNKDSFKGGYYGGPMYLEGDMAVGAVATPPTTAAPAPAVKTSNTMARDSSESASNSQGNVVDFSVTNVQKSGIDEPDIIKTDGSYIYYINNQKKILYIIKGPYNGSNLDISSANIVKMIRLPKTFEANNLIIGSNTLTLIATRYMGGSFNYNTSFFDTNSRTSVVVFDTTNKSSPTILRLLDFPGNFQDARLVNGKVFVVSNLYFNRGPIYRIMTDKKSIDDVVTPNSVIPSGVEVVKQANGKYSKGIYKPDCANLEYVLPDKVENFNPSVGIVHTIDLKQSSKTQTNLFYGNAGQIHVTDKSLYTVASISLGSYNSPCPLNAKCAMPMIRRAPDNFSLIHKYSITSGKPIYQDSSLVKGDLLNQYSMDEDNNGNFRILTRSRSPELATHLWVFDKTLKLSNTLLNIEPKEDFKASRFMGDKLYLVTFQQIDPLFVIDLVGAPKILGQLKIPGFSQYLHPYSPMANGKQLLLGLGTDTIETGGRVMSNGVKLDLYEINYNLIADGSISIKQLQTKTLGGKNSWTEATDNPRVFVRNDKTKQLFLPIITQQEIEKKMCNKDYYGQEYCYPSYTYDTTFAGMKTLKVDVSGISEVSSKDYKDQIISYLKSSNQYYGSEYNNFGLDQWQFMQLGNRAGFVGDVSYFINNAGADFNSSKEGKYIAFK